MIESGFLIQNFVDTDTELTDAETMMPENDDATLFGVHADAEGQLELADDELAEAEQAEEDANIPSYQLQVAENETGRSSIGRMSYRDLG